MRRRRRGKKIRRRRDWSVDDFDSMEIRLGKSAKFDGAGVYEVGLFYNAPEPTRASICQLQVSCKQDTCRTNHLVHC